MTEEKGGRAVTFGHVTVLPPLPKVRVRMSRMVFLVEEDLYKVRLQTFGRLRIADNSV